MYYGYTNKNCETAQHTYLYGQIVRLKKVLSKRRFFSFNAELETLHGDLP